jgi:hypothetical protein
MRLTVMDGMPAADVWASYRDAERLALLSI